MAGHDHPVFTRIYRLVARLEDDGPVGRARTEAASLLSGRVLIVGLGPGEDLHHLPTSVTEVLAVEPSRPMRRAARPAIAKAQERGLSVKLMDAVAEDLPLSDNSVDSVLLAYVMCTVGDVPRALAEVRRVLRPGGVVGVLEHVAALDSGLYRRAQKLVRPVWPHVAGGCHADRDTREALELAGFDVSEIRDEVLVNLPPVAPAIVGTARLCN